MPTHEGGCLCRGVRYATSADPTRVTICYCTFCQVATGAAGMIEPIFKQADFRIIAGKPATFDMASRGSGKRISIHFCATCGTKLSLSFERFADIVGVYCGTFDDPNWFDRSPANTKYIFTGVAQAGTIIPAGYNTFTEHAWLNDGTVVEPIVYGAPKTVVR